MNRSFPAIGLGIEQRRFPAAARRRAAGSHARELIAATDGQRGGARFDRSLDPLPLCAPRSFETAICSWSCPPPKKKTSISSGIGSPMPDQLTCDCHSAPGGPLLQRRSRCRGRHRCSSWSDRASQCGCMRTGSISTRHSLLPERLTDPALPAPAQLQHSGVGRQNTNPGSPCRQSRGRMRRAPVVRSVRSGMSRDSCDARIFQPVGHVRATNAGRRHWQRRPRPASRNRHPRATRHHGRRRSRSLIAIRVGSGKPLATCRSACAAPR